MLLPCYQTTLLLYQSIFYSKFTHAQLVWIFLCSRKCSFVHVQIHWSHPCSNPSYSSPRSVIITVSSPSSLFVERWKRDISILLWIFWLNIEHTIRKAQHFSSVINWEQLKRLEFLCCVPAFDVLKLFELVQLYCLCRKIETSAKWESKRRWTFRIWWTFENKFQVFCARKSFTLHELNFRVHLENFSFAHSQVLERNLQFSSIFNMHKFE